MRLGALLLTALLVSGCLGAPSCPPSATEPPRKAAPPAPELPPLTGDQVGDRLARNLEVAYEKLVYDMELRGRQGTSERRRVVFHRASGLEGKSSAYTVFTAPPEIDGFGLMSFRSPGKDPEQFLFVPASPKIQRITYYATNRRASFCGTQFTFEDLEPFEVEDFTFDVKGSTLSKEGRPSYVVEVVPRSESSGYERITEIIDGERFLVLRGDYVDRRGRRLKTLTAAGPIEVSPGRWRSREVVMKDHQSQQTTRMTLVDHVCRIDETLPEDRAIFTFETLSQGREK